MNAERWLRILLRAAGAAMMLAAVALFMPRAWMAAAHEWLGLGAFPEAPIAEYLARVLSGMYAILGGLLWLLARRPRRYGRIIRYLAVAVALLALVIVVYGLRMGMPAYWVLGDAATAVGFAAVVVILLRLARA